MVSRVSTINTHEAVMVPDEEAPAVALIQHIVEESIEGEISLVCLKEIPVLLHIPVDVVVTEDMCVVAVHQEVGVARETCGVKVNEGEDLQSHSSLTLSLISSLPMPSLQRMILKKS